MIFESAGRIGLRARFGFSYVRSLWGRTVEYRPCVGRRLPLEECRDPRDERGALGSRSERRPRACARLAVSPSRPKATTEARRERAVRVVRAAAAPKRAGSLARTAGPRVAEPAKPGRAESRPAARRPAARAVVRAAG